MIQIAIALLISELLNRNMNIFVGGNKENKCSMVPCQIRIGIQRLTGFDFLLLVEFLSVYNRKIDYTDVLK